MKTTLIKSEQRGAADHGWLKAKHSFSFAQFYREDMVHFGALRVLNDDFIAPNMGFGTHPHDNMEIITIPLSGAISHRDSTGGNGTIPAGDVQVMSAGKGVTHSEFNASATDSLSLYQIWIFPHTRNVTPRYDQKSFDVTNHKNDFVLLVSPDGQDSSLQIHQNAFISRGIFDKDQNISVSPKLAENGIYIMLTEGEIEIDGKRLQKRDAIAVSEFSSLEINVIQAADILLIEVPMLELS